MPRRSRSRSPLETSSRKHGKWKEDEYHYRQRSKSKSKHKRRSRSKERGIYSYGKPSNYSKKDENKANSRDRKKRNSRSPERDRHRHSKRSRSREMHRKHSPRRNRSGERKKRSRSREYKRSRSRRKSLSSSPSNYKREGSTKEDRSRKERGSHSKEKQIKYPTSSSNTDYVRQYSHESKEKFVTEHHTKSREEIDATEKVLASQEMSGLKSWREFEEYVKKEEAAALHKTVIHEKGVTEVKIAKQTSGEDVIFGRTRTCQHPNKEDTISAMSQMEKLGKDRAKIKQNSINETEHKLVQSRHQREEIDGSATSKIEDLSAMHYQKDRKNRQSTMIGNIEGRYSTREDTVNPMRNIEQLAKTGRRPKREESRSAKHEFDNNTNPKTNLAQRYHVKEKAISTMRKMEELAKVENDSEKEGSPSAGSETEDETRRRYSSKKNAMRMMEELAKAGNEPDQVDDSSRECEIEHDAMSGSSSRSQYPVKKEAINAMKKMEELGRGDTVCREMEIEDDSVSGPSNRAHAMKLMEESAKAQNVLKRGDSPYAESETEDITIPGTSSRPQFPSKEEAINAMRMMEELAKAQNEPQRGGSPYAESETEDEPIPGTSGRPQFPTKENAINAMRMMEESASTESETEDDVIPSTSSRPHFVADESTKVQRKPILGDSPSTESGSEEDDKYPGYIPAQLRAMYAMNLSKGLSNLESGNRQSATDDPVPGTSSAWEGISQETVDNDMSEIKASENIKSEDENSTEDEAPDLNVEQTAENVPQPQVVPEEEEKTFEFSCSNCELQERCHYIGKHPDFANNVQFLEDCYVMKDPFSPPPPKFIGTKAEYFIVLGSHCAVCGDVVCKAPQCSIFYLKTFCLPCAEINTDQFPKQIGMKIKMQMKK